MRYYCIIFARQSFAQACQIKNTSHHRPPPPQITLPVVSRPLSILLHQLQHSIHVTITLAASLLLDTTRIRQGNRLAGRQGRSLAGRFFGLHVSTRHESINFRENALKGRVNATGIQGRRFNKGQIVLFGKGHGFIRFHGTQVSEIRLVSDEHDDNVGFGVVS